MRRTEQARVFALIALMSLPAASPTAQEATGFVRVNTDPPGAAVYLDGVMKDVSPVVVSDVEPGTHLLSVRKDGYVETRRTIRLSPDQRMVVDLVLEPITGLVLVQSSPTGAGVRVEDTDRGQTPLLLTDLPVGKYRVNFMLPGYLPKQVDLNIEDRTPLKIDVTMQSTAAKLTVRSEPSGADVILNGIAMGTTPCELARIPSGKAIIEVTSAGYKPFKQTLTLHAGQEDEMEIVLKPIPSELTVVSIPEKARIYVDNQFRGRAPVTLSDIDPGEYRVRAELEGYAPLARSVAVPRNASLVEEFRLEANSGIIEITTEPAGVRVFIDGNEAGTTQAEEGETDRLSKPLTIRLISQGEHKLQLSREGYFAESVTIQIKRDETITRHVKLRRRFIPDYEVVTQTGTERGVLLQIDPAGNVRLEVRPGIIKTIRAGDIKSGRPIRED